jgi:hypothetical protein
MTYIYEAPNLTGGIDNAFVDLSGTVPTFMPMFLLFVFGIVFISGMSAQKRKNGYVDVPMWSTLASISTLMITLSLTLIAGLIQIEVLSVVVAVTILSGAWLFLDKNRNEV